MMLLMVVVVVVVDTAVIYRVARSKLASDTNSATRCFCRNETSLKRLDWVCTTLISVQHMLSQKTAPPTYGSKCRQILSDFHNPFTRGSAAATCLSCDGKYYALYWKVNTDLAVQKIRKSVKIWRSNRDACVVEFSGTWCTVYFVQFSTIVFTRRTERLSEMHAWLPSL